jgi:hypothetical protein
MKASVVAGSLLSGLVLVALPMQAQQVSAEVEFHGGPVAGHVLVRDGYSTYHRPPVVYRREPVRRVVVVEVEQSRRHRSASFWRRHGFRPVVLYYIDGRYYDRPVWRRGVPAGEVTVYERDGRHYREWHDDWSHGRPDREHGHGQHGHRHHDWDD